MLETGSVLCRSLIPQQQWEPRKYPQRRLPSLRARVQTRQDNGGFLARSLSGDKGRQSERARAVGKTEVDEFLARSWRELGKIRLGKGGQARMRPGKLLFVWVLVCVGIFWGEYGALHVKGDLASDFLDEKQVQVVRIANLSVINEASTCDLVASCSDQGQCSRGACLPIQNDNLNCTYVAVNTNCFEDPVSQKSPCMNTLANFQRSIVRVPGGVTGQVPFEVQNSVCSQRRLDPLFQELQKLQNSSQYFFNFYFGSVDGTFRSYPAVEVNDCYLYDPRIRPWYKGSISVLKDVIILLDAGYSMGDNLGLATYQTTRLAAAQNTTQQILMTLTPNDRVTVITFNASSQANTIAPSGVIVPETGVNLTGSNLLQLLDSVNTTTPSTSGSSVNFTAGFYQAVSTFGQNSPSGALKIIILFTDGLSDVPSTAELVSIVAEFQQQHIRLFIYNIGDTDNPGLGQLACQVEGFAERLNALNLIQNPLFTVNSYFSFLARSQLNTTDGTRPFWQTVYSDYGNLGNVITVAYPALSSDGSRLIGVAGIDVQTDGLNVNFRSVLDNDLTTTRRTTISTNTIGAAFPACNPAYNNSLGQCSTSSPTLSPFCPKSDNTSSYLDLVCCATCGVPAPARSDSKKTDSKNILIIAIVVPVLALAAVLALSVFLWFRFCRNRAQPSDYGDFVKVPKFSYETLSLATNKFQEGNKLGFGTFGTVYRGTLENGTRVAVKKLSHQPSHGLRDFEAEIKVLATANHTNLVALKGFCVEQSHILVYEFVENGDLDNWLFVKPTKEGKILPWGGRMTTAKGVAKGLAYLHEDLQNRQKVCHSDIKPANILLDAEFNPKVADFGMAKLYEGGSEMFSTGGTLGYVAPEILGGAPATTRTDVYSFGMVLLEMVTGRRFSDSGIKRNLPQWAAMTVAAKKDTELFDPLLGQLEEGDGAMASRLIRIALLCTSINPDLRPDMGDVIKMIDGFLEVRSLPVSLHNDSMAELNHTFSTETSSLGWNRSRSDKSAASGVFPWEKTWTFSEAIKKLKFRSGRPSPSSSKEPSLSRSMERPVSRPPLSRPTE